MKVFSDKVLPVWLPIIYTVVTVFLWRGVELAIVHAETTIIPSAFATGRYDTNIFFVPSSFLPPGQETDDYVGTVGARAEVLHKSRQIDASLKVGGDLNGFVRNTNLNYATASVGGYAILDRWVQQYTRGARLSLTESFLFTPQPPGFLTGVRGPVADNPFLQGVQQFRSNTWSNVTGVNAQYPIIRKLSVRGSYTFSIRKIGSLLALTSTGAAFFNTIVHTWSAGPTYQLTREDSIALLYRQQLIDQERRTGSQAIKTNAQEIGVEYRRVLEKWEISLLGGATLVEPASEWFPTTRLRIAASPDRLTTVALILARQARPSFFLTSGVIISNLVQIEIVRKLSDRLTFGGNANYAYNESVPARALKIQSISVGTGLNYKLTRAFSVDLSYSYRNIDNEFPSLTYQLSRHVVALTLAAEWK